MNQNNWIKTIFFILLSILLVILATSYCILLFNCIYGAVNTAAMYAVISTSAVTALMLALYSFWKNYTK